MMIAHESVSVPEGRKTTMTGLIIRTLALMILLTAAIIGLVFGFFAFLSFPSTPWNLLWRLVLCIVCLWIIIRIGSFGLQKRETELGESTGPAPGTYLVVSAAYDSVPNSEGTEKRELVFILRRLGNDLKERFMHVINPDLLVGLSDAFFERALIDNFPKFRFCVKPDGSRTAVLYQEAQGGRWLHQLEIEL